MTSDHPSIPVLELKGTPGQIGAAHGEMQRERIAEYVDRFVEWLVRGSAVPLTEEALWQTWAGQVAVNQRLAPDLMEEMRGIARGAAVPFERIFLLNSLLDLNSFRYFRLAQAFVGCTTFAVVATADTGTAAVGQTYDMPELHGDYLTLLRLRPVDGPQQLVFTFAGVVGAAGFNEEGIGVNINYLSPLDVGSGRLHSLIVRQIVGSRQLADAVTPAVLPPRAGGAHFLIAQADGFVLSIETTAQRYATFLPEGNAIGHTNHYLSPWLKEVEFLRPRSIGGSLARYAALRRFLTEVGPELTVERLKDLTRNHTSFPRSICGHGCSDDAPGNRTLTVAAMVQDLANRQMHITSGCACENAYHCVTL